MSFDWWVVAVRFFNQSRCLIRQTRFNNETRPIFSSDVWVWNWISKMSKWLALKSDFEFSKYKLALSVYLLLTASIMISLINLILCASETVSTTSLAVSLDHVSYCLPPYTLCILPLPLQTRKHLSCLKTSWAKERNWYCSDKKQKFTSGTN